MVDGGARQEGYRVARAVIDAERFWFFVIVQGDIVSRVWEREGFAGEPEESGGKERDRQVRSSLW